MKITIPTVFFIVIAITGFMSGYSYGSEEQAPQLSVDFTSLSSMLNPPHFKTEDFMRTNSYLEKHRSEILGTFDNQSTKLFVVPSRYDNCYEVVIYSNILLSPAAKRNVEIIIQESMLNALDLQK